MSVDTIAMGSQMNLYAYLVYMRIVLPRTLSLLSIKTLIRTVRYAISQVLEKNHVSKMNVVIYST